MPHNGKLHVEEGTRGAFHLVTARPAHLQRPDTNRARFAVCKNLDRVSDRAAEVSKLSDRKWSSNKSYEVHARDNGLQSVALA